MQRSTVDTNILSSHCIGLILQKEVGKLYKRVEKRCMRRSTRRMWVRSRW